MVKKYIPKTTFKIRKKTNKQTDWLGDHKPKQNLVSVCSSEPILLPSTMIDLKKIDYSRKRTSIYVRSTVERWRVPPENRLFVCSHISESVSVFCYRQRSSSLWKCQRLSNSEHRVAWIEFLKNRSSCCSWEFLQLRAKRCLFLQTYPILIKFLLRFSLLLGHWLRSQCAWLPLSLPSDEQTVWSFQGARQTWPAAMWRKQRRELEKKLINQ